jgi:serine protease AprX
VVATGVVVVASAGNTGAGGDGDDGSGGFDIHGVGSSITEPAHAERAITVGATHRDSPHSFGVWYRSAKGPTLDGRRKPDLVAPGEKITSAASGRLRDQVPAAVWATAPATPAAPPVAMGGTTGVEQPSPAAPAPSEPAVPAAGAGSSGSDSTESADSAGSADAAPVAYYAEDSGTSMAAPHVSGAIAAFLSVRQEFIGQPDVTKDLFCVSAVSLGREPGFEGHGLVDLMAVLSKV